MWDIVHTIVFVCGIASVIRYDGIETLHTLTDTLTRFWKFVLWKRRKFLNCAAVYAWLGSTTTLLNLIMFDHLIQCPPCFMYCNYHKNWGRHHRNGHKIIYIHLNQHLDIRSSHKSFDLSNNFQLCSKKIKSKLFEKKHCFLFVFLWFSHLFPAFRYVFGGLPRSPVRPAPWRGARRGPRLARRSATGSPRSVASRGARPPERGAPGDCGPLGNWWMVGTINIYNYLW